MLVEPNTNIRILHNVPLNPNYKNTIYFANASDQETYFVNETKYNLTAQSYQRVQRGMARIAINAENLYDCNYMMFQNTAFGTKWFYAFITKVEYVNDLVSEVTFVIDVMQTWFFEAQVQMCFVEREHSTTDVAGDNIIAEPIDTGPMIANQIDGTGLFNLYVAVVATAYNPDGQAGGIIAGMFTGLSYYVCEIDNQSQVQEILTYLEDAAKANKTDSIACIFVMPSDFFTKDATPVIRTRSISKPNQLNGYYPKNKKLLTSPYCYLGVDCGNNSTVYKYEYFTTNDCQFKMSSNVSPNPEIALIPTDYNGASFNYVEELVMNGFPQIGYSVDSYKAWVAMHAGETLLGMAGNTAGMALGAGSGSASGVIGGALGLAQGINSIAVAQNLPPQARGNSNASVSVAMRTKDFYFKHMSIRAEYAKTIDDFFTMYGYATNRLKIPNRSFRPHWNYVKTKDCVIKGNVPADDMKAICSIYDNGVTFWKKGVEVGLYSLDNSIT